MSDSFYILNSFAFKEGNMETNSVQGTIFRLSAST